MITLEQFKANLSEIQEKIEGAAGKAGVSPESIRLMAVSKTFPLEAVEVACQAGCTLFGENRVQEAGEKFAAFQAPVELHLIGHLQSNKAKQAAGLFSCIQSIDKFSTAAEVNKQAAKLGKTIDFLIEVNTSHEDSKFGTRGEEAFLELLDRTRELSNLNLRGLMTIGPFTRDVLASRRAFALLRNFYEKAGALYGDLKMDTLSMGMSMDFEAAILEGANLLRIGSSLFGAR